ncbi:MAG TPA: hypothetical protein ENL21_06425 [Caldithrix abyssi]|uniref:Uncharacterized protein n=1 Tax=Caldithrix abyssi TaxID=187145 RepID=A0A7V5H4K8_CALAY|nr:hypothetical protein [Caldithrix abyssi]
MRNFFIFILIFSLTSLLMGKDFKHYRQAITPRLSAGGQFNILKQSMNIAKPYQQLGLTKPQGTNVTETVPFIEGPVTESINYDTDKAYNGYAQTSPDNFATVGPNHFVLVTQLAIHVYTSATLYAYFTPE